MFDSSDMLQVDEKSSCQVNPDYLVQIEITSELAEYLTANRDPSHKGIHKFCRVCLLDTGGDMFDIYSTNDGYKLSYILSSFTGFLIDIEDGLPAKVCLGCKELIVQCHSFKTKCKQSETALRACIQHAVFHDGDEKDFSTKQEITGVLIHSPEHVGYEALDIASDYDDHTDIKIENPMENLTHNEGQTEEPFCKTKHDAKLRSVSRVESKKKQKLACEVCYKICKDEFKLSKHMKLHVNKGNCEICGKVCKSGRGLHRHILLAHSSNGGESRTIDCTQCQSSFFSKKDLEIHSALHSGKLQCYACHKDFQSIQQLKRHIKRHMDNKPYKCEECNKEFTELSSLHRHQRIHLGTVVEKKHTCTVCGKKFADSSSLTVHMRSHTGEKPFECQQCGRGFMSTRLLNSHKKTHDDRKPHKCKICNKSFRHSATLATHRRTHTGERPYICSICGKTFIQSSNLTLHLRVHSGERPYQCKVCNNKFTSWSTMKSHERTHTGEKPYSCKVCGQRFARMDMKVHMRRHTGERPFSCSLCNKSFYTLASLSDHNRFHSGIKPYECNICGHHLVTKSNLVKHIKRHQISNDSKINIMHKMELEGEKIAIITKESSLEMCDYVANTETVMDQTAVKEECLDIPKEVMMLEGLSGDTSSTVVEVRSDCLTPIFKDISAGFNGRRVHMLRIENSKD